MGVFSLAGAGIVLSLSGLTLGAASEPTAAGFDYAGLAALVASITGLVSAIGAIIIGLRRRANDPTEKALQILLEQQQKSTLAKSLEEDEEVSEPAPRPKKKTTQKRTKGTR